MGTSKRNEMRIMSLIFAVATAARNDCSRFLADISILVDASNDVGQNGFDDQIKFTRSVINWLPNVGTDCRIKVVPYSWTLDKPLTSKPSYKEWHFKRILDKVKFQARKGPRKQLKTIATELTGRYFDRPRPGAKRIAILITAEKSEEAKNAVVQSYFSKYANEPDKIPFVIAIGVDQTKNLKNLMKIAENPCYVLTVPTFQKLPISLPIVK